MQAFNRRATDLPLRTLRLFTGLFLFALGVVMTLRAELGISPWDVLADGIELNTPLSFGQAVIAIGAALIAVSFFFNVRPGPGTIANMIFIGLFADMLLATDIGGGLDDGHLVTRLAVLLGGVAVIGLGSAFYIGAQLGAGPRDSLMVSVATRTNLSVRLSRTLIEGSALIVGIILGGSFGIGTAIFAVTIGPSVHLFFDLFGMDAAGRKRVEMEMSVPLESLEAR
jgi:uncharacterized membrane protein YczE